MTISFAENGAVTLEKSRHEVCMEAVWEIEAIASMLPDMVDRTDEVAMQNHLRVRCMAGRLVELSNALMAGLADESVRMDGLGGLNRKILLCDMPAMEP